MWPILRSLLAVSGNHLFLHILRSIKIVHKAFQFNQLTSRLSPIDKIDKLIF